MTQQSDTELFPAARVLADGALLASIAHAVMMTRYPDLAHQYSWSESVYSVKDDEGGRAAISFGPRQVVAAFFVPDSSRSPYRSGKSALDTLTRGMPRSLEVTREKTLAFLFDELGGVAQPVCTALMWTTGERLTSTEPWSAVLAHGARIVHRETLPFVEGLEAWSEDYEMNAAERRIVTELFDWKHASRAAELTMSAAHKRKLLARCVSKRAEKECRASFGELGIQLG